MTIAGTLFREATDPTNRANPYPLYAELRRTPVALLDNGTPLVSTYQENMQLLHDPRVSSDPHNRVGTHGLPTSHLTHSFINMDPPDHDRWRQTLMWQFGPPHTPGRVEGMRPRITEIATRHIDALIGRSRVDIVEDLAYPLPVEVICELLGVPLADADRLHEWSTAAVSRLDPVTAASANAEQRSRTDQAEAEFQQYMRTILAERRAHPGDDLLSALVSADPIHQLNDVEATTNAMLLMIAGHETTVNLIANGVLTFLRHPEVLQRLRSEPMLVFSAVEELLRYEPPVQFRERTALADMQVAGVRIPKGSPMVMLLAAANRDEARFSNADRFVPDRADNEHLGFLTGLHYCFGAPLARLEAQIVLREFIRRFEQPGLVIDPPPYRPNAALRGPSQLLVDVRRVRESEVGKSPREKAA